MARILFQTLTRNLWTRGGVFSGMNSGGITLPPPVSRIVGVRLQSGGPDAWQLVEMDLGSGVDSANVEVDILSLRKLQDAIQGFVIQKSAPKWLPFVPGASYWIPPVPQGLGSLEIIDRPEKELNKEEALSEKNSRWWPSSSYFLDGVKPHQNTISLIRSSAFAAQSDDEE